MVKPKTMTTMTITIGMKVITMTTIGGKTNGALTIGVGKKQIGKVTKVKVQLKVVLITMDGAYQAECQVLKTLGIELSLFLNLLSPAGALLCPVSFPSCSSTTECVFTSQEFHRTSGQEFHRADS